MGIGYPYQTRFKTSCDYSYNRSVKEYWVWYHIVVNRAFTTMGVILAVIFLHLARFDFTSDPQVYSLYQVAFSLWLSVVITAGVGTAWTGIYALGHLCLFLVKFYTAKDLYY